MRNPSNRSYAPAAMRLAGELLQGGAAGDRLSGVAAANSMITAPVNPRVTALACGAGTPSVHAAAARLNDSAEPGAGQRSGPPCADGASARSRPAR